MAKLRRVFTIYDNMDFAPVPYAEYPKMLYATDGAQHVVADKADEVKYLSQGWFDHPSKASAADPELAEISKLTKAKDMIETTVRAEVEQEYKDRMQAMNVRLAQLEALVTKTTAPAESPKPVETSKPIVLKAS